PERLAGEGYAAFLHSLKQRGLSFGCGPVDLVGQDDVAEDRAFLELKASMPVLLDHDVGAGDVGRHQVRRELDATEGYVYGIGKCSDQHGLAQPGYAFEQNVTADDETDQGLVDDFTVTDDDLADLALQLAHGLRELFGL